MINTGGRAGNVSRFDYTDRGTYHKMRRGRVIKEYM